MLRTVLFVAMVLMWTGLSAQIDSVKNRIMNNRVSKEVKNRIWRKQKDTTVVAVKSEAAFMPYKDKFIRRIYIRQIGFERSIYDSSRRIRDRITRLANTLHYDTRESVIRNHLFLREKRQLNPYKVADNERYLRDLDFILDSKIIVHRVPGQRDSVDLEVVTRDVFSLGFTGSVKGLDEYVVGVYDANVGGMGQRVQADLGFEGGRNPAFAWDVIYRKSSIMGTLINAYAGYTRLDNSRSLGEEYEHAFFVRLDRPLVSPYSRFAGGFEASQNWSKNVYRTSDSLFRQYRYNFEDVWVGYNLGANSFTNRHRYFAAMRYFRQHYSKQPSQEWDRVRGLYNDQRFLLGSFTFYDQNFYKTRYVYGFGRTEDVPYGQTITLTSGWMEELAEKRLYSGLSVLKSFVHKGGNFYQIEGAFGTFYRAKKAEDAFLSISGQYYSKLFATKRFKVRQLVEGGYARAFNPRIREMLTLNEELKGFSPDSLYGAQRIILRTETTLYTSWIFAGFRCAPFVSLESAHLRAQAPVVLPKNFFFGATGGFRIRNENLIFGTIELRAFYFPEAIDGVDHLSFRITTNLRLKYSGRFVTPPSLVRYNN
ncbi:BamA/TamA family outer membrane protein [Parachryseolinea silvisoli]|uniref:hypothetical protein n=1 Tax=Parachryseolinea silvisoli TaxID=2873601 RepID=UPI002265F075|nr:hypothetical protein [Parachryseolinea silvisoli]MCD9015891.1 hypothetical protein [Parachryseolinea silvisoli]